MAYSPIPAKDRPSFCGLKTYMRLPHVETLEEVDFLVVGIPFDVMSLARVGQRGGPNAIRAQSMYCKGYHPEHAVDIFSFCSGVDYGDLNVLPGDGIKSVNMVREQMLPIFQKGIVPFCLGGEHTISYPILAALAETQGPVALVHFDAHSDIYKEYLGLKYHQGNPFRLAIEDGAVIPGNSIQLGIRGPEYSPADRAANKELGLEMIPGVELHQIGITEAVRRIRSKVQDMPVYISFDIDFLDAAYAPGACIPIPGGFTTAQAFELLRGLRGINLRGFDVVCLVPEYDAGNITAIAAAYITWEAIALHACNRIKD